MARKSDEGVAPSVESLLELVGLETTGRAYVDRRIVGRPRRIENRGSKPDRRLEAADRRTGLERRMFARLGGPGAAPVSGSARVIQEVLSSVQQLRTQPPRAPASMPVEQKFLIDFLSWGTGDPTRPGDERDPGPNAQPIVAYLRDRARAQTAQSISIETGNGQIARVGSVVTVAVRVIDGFAPVHGASLRFVDDGGERFAGTGTDGLAQTTWEIRKPGARTLRADLLSSPDPKSPVLGSVEFTAFGVL